MKLHHQNSLQMKAYFLFLSLFTICPAIGQVLGSVDISHLDSIQTVEVFIERPAGKWLDVFLDYGQADNSNYATIIGGSRAALTIVDGTTGKKILFKSTASVLNFMNRHQWEHYDTVAAVETTVFGALKQSGYFYYFRRKVSNK